MPVVGSSAYNTAGQITSLVRSLLNDSQGNLFTDTVLLPYANSAYRKTQRALYDREHRQERTYDAWAYDLLDDAVPAFHKQPFVTAV